MGVLSGLGGGRSYQRRLRKRGEREKLGASLSGTVLMTPRLMSMSERESGQCAFVGQREQCSGVNSIGVWLGWRVEKKGQWEIRLRQICQP